MELIHNISTFHICENAVVFRYFVLVLIIEVNWSTSTERVRAPRDGNFNINRVHKSHNYVKT